MPLSKNIAEFNKKYTNKLVGPLVPKFVHGATLVHVGRKSGDEYRIPILAFRHEGRVVIALTYGKDVDWLKNVMSAKGGRLELEGEALVLKNPQLQEFEEPPEWMPAHIRVGLRIVNVSDYVFFEVKK